MKKIAILASGTGSNARRLVEHFKTHSNIEVGLILSNKADAPVLNMAKEHNIPQQVFDKKTFRSPESILPVLRQAEIDFIVLAGFLWLIPQSIIDAFPRRIINLHPALLPKYGGKGMYGMYVHEAVRAANETETGITIHYVNEAYDEGDIVFQASCIVKPEDTPQQIAQKIHQLEHANLPVVTEKLVMKL